MKRTCLMQKIFDEHEALECIDGKEKVDAMRLYTKEEMLGFLGQLKTGVENGSYILNPWYGEADPKYPEQWKEAMLLELEMAIKTTEYMFNDSFDRG